MLGQEPISLVDYGPAPVAAAPAAPAGPSIWGRIGAAFASGLGTAASLLINSANQQLANSLAVPAPPGAPVRRQPSAIPAWLLPVGVAAAAGVGVILVMKKS